MLIGKEIQSKLNSSIKNYNLKKNPFSNFFFIMRLIIRYCLPFVHQTTFVIEVEPHINIEQLKLKILERCKITHKNVLFKIERDEYIVNNY